MPDWSSYVRMHLRLTAVRPERESEIIEDLARQLDEAYREALRQGANESDARGQAEAHISDWAALSREISASPRGRLTIAASWQQNAEDRAIRKRGGFSMFTELRQDILYGLRTLWKSPGVTAIAVPPLALGTGANTAIFSVINSLLLQNLPVRDPQQLASLSDPEASGAMSGVQTGVHTLFSFHEFENLRDNNDVFTSLMAFCSPIHKIPVATGGGDATASPQVLMASADYFSTLGAEPMTGRTFSSDVHHGIMDHPQAVISYAFWQRRMQADQNVIGLKIRLRQNLFDVIGVMPPTFTGAEVGTAPDIYIPLTMQRVIVPRQDVLTQAVGKATRVLFLHVVGRLKPGVTLAQAQASANITFQSGLQLEAASVTDASLRKDLLDETLAAHPAQHDLSAMRGNYQRPLEVLMALVALLLLLAWRASRTDPMTALRYE